jgi:nickel-dependent lactate racemase
VTHDPDDETNLCLVGVPKRREPLRINRTIYDADVVLPIGCARVNGRGPYDSLFPAFAGAEAVDRYRTPAGHDTAAGQADMARETTEAGWLIGVSMVITVVPGTNDSVASVVAGEPQATARRSAQLCRERWALRSPRRAGLVIATLGGGPAAQTWTNVGRALASANRMVDDDGAIAICTNLEEPPGPSLGRLIGSSDLAATERQIAHDHADDSWPAWQLVRALRQGTVYLLSQLDADTVEEMGMAPVANVDELVRLAGRCESYIVLDDAQHAVATVDGDADES